MSSIALVDRSLVHSHLVENIYNVLGKGRGYNSKSIHLFIQGVQLLKGHFLHT